MTERRRRSMAGEAGRRWSLRRGSVVGGAWRRWSLRDWLVDALVFLAGVFGFLSIYGEVEQQPISEGLRAADWIGGVALLPLIWLRRRWPVQLALLSAGVTVFSDSAASASLIFIISVAIERPWRTTAWVFAVNLMTLPVNMIYRNTDEPWQAVAVAAIALYLAATGWGLYMRSRRELLQTLRDRAERAETVARLQSERAQLRAREELAREMHDVLGHRLSLLSVHAGALAYRPDASSAEIAGAAEVIRAGAHQALQDLREVIGVLRAPVGELPQPAFVDLPMLIEDSRRAGVEVELQLDATGTPPDHIGRTAYRIVQEGLTNALKHAPGRPVRVEVTGAPGNGLAVELRNPAPTASGSGGQGLIGLSERAALVEGRLEHGRTADGAFRLAAWLPWPA